MRISIFAFSRCGINTAELVQRALVGPETDIYIPQSLSDGLPYSLITKPSVDFYEQRFHESDALIFIGSCGIAVRSIAPHVRSKLTDPAVLCIDDRGAYIIPILSGHIGGANAFARMLAEKLRAQPIITTATDIHERFSVDTWASVHGFIMDDMDAAKAISAGILEQNIPVCGQLPLPNMLPNGLVPGESGSIGIFIGWEVRSPFEKTLRIIPRYLHLGIGCRKGTTARRIAEAVDSVLAENHIDTRAIKSVASIDLKANEEGLLTYCCQSDLPASFYSVDKLWNIPGNFTGSEFVSKVTGVDNVCERAAMMESDRLIVPKTVCSGVTVAVGAEIREVCFE